LGILKENLIQLNNSSAINNDTDDNYLKKINDLMLGKKNNIIPK